MSSKFRARDIKIYRKSSNGNRKLKREGSHTEGEFHEVACHLQSNPHIHSGYRMNHKSPADVLKSIFSLHNETLNIWSHLVPAIVMCSWLVNSYDTVGAMLKCYTIACVFLFIASSVYHLFKCQNQHTYDLCLKLDFSGIVAVIASSFLAGIYYGFHCFPKIRNFFLVVTGAINAFLMYVAVGDKDNYHITTRRIFYVAGVAWSIVPMAAFFMIYDLYTDTEAFQMAKSCLTLLGGYGSAFAVYSSKFPEKWWPGKFDFIGHSHQTWHVLIAASAIWWYWSLEQARLWALSGVCPTL